MSQKSSLRSQLAPWLDALGFLAGVGLIIAAEQQARRQPPEKAPPAQPKRFRGINRPIDLLYDDRDIPHVRAFSTPDLFFGQGYATASARFWQMDLNRRVGAGTLAALVGESVLDHDRLMRRIGLRRLAEAMLERLDPAVRGHLEAYAAGVNAYLSERDGWQVSVEHALLRASGLCRAQWLAEPQPWTPVDSLVFANYMSWVMAVGWDSELLRARLLAAAGPERLAEIDPAPLAAKPFHVPEGIDWAAVDLDLGTFAPFVAWGGPAASNAWAVAAERTETGGPLLANDLHLVPRVPATWFEIHLLGEEYNVIGASLPGVPGVLVGHNGQVAWGITAGFADTQDLIVHRFSNDGLTYDAPGAPPPAIPVPVDIVEERIDVLGRSGPVIERVRITRDGPVLSKNPSSPLQIALRSVTLDADSSPASALFGIMRATSAAELREALREWVAPCLNFAFADAAGNIGWQLAGRVPKRRQGDGLIPVPGWDAAYEWDGYLRFEDLPHAVNPPDGLVWSANNAPVSGQSGLGDGAEAASDPALGFEFMDGFRAQRISDLLRATAQHNVGSFRAMQSDTYSIPAKALVTLLARLEPADERESLALGLLRAWDGRLEVASAGAAVYGTLKTRLLDRLLFRNAGGLVPYFLGVGPSEVALPISSFGFRYSSHLLATLRRLLDDPARQDAAAADIRGALRESIDYLRETCGRDPGAWAWGALHRLRLPHAFDALPGIGRFFNLTTVPYPGEDDTIVQAGLGPAGLLPSRRTNLPPELARRVPDYLAVGGFVPAYRFIADLANPDNSRSVLPTGQSGRRGSRRYADQFQAWLEHRDFPLYFGWQAIVQHTWERVRLSPKLDA